jgi:hypothetical protein
VHTGQWQIQTDLLSDWGASGHCWAVCSKL